MNVRQSRSGAHLRLVSSNERVVERPRTDGLLTVTHQDRGSLWVVSLSGEADIGTRDELAQGLAEALSEERQVVVVDVSELQFCDSRCATVVIEANLSAPETQLILVGGRGMVSRVFDLLDPAGTLPRHPGRAGARPSTFGGLEGRGAHDLPPVRRT
jgi:anti-anti-sigma factor